MEGITQESIKLGRKESAQNKTLVTAFMGRVSEQQNIPFVCFAIYLV